MTTRGLTEKDFIKIADIIIEALNGTENFETLKNKVKEITTKYPLYK